MSSSNNNTYKKTSFLAGSNTEFINEFYADYLSDPKSIPESWKLFFDGLRDDKKLVNELFANLKKHRKDLPQKSSTVKAINYAINNEAALMHFLDDGQIAIDNNAAERAMRGIALGRKNWMFAGSDKVGHTAANIYSLIETAKINNINPWRYLEKVFDVIQDYNSNKLHELLPWNITL